MHSIEVFSNPTKKGHALKMHFFDYNDAKYQQLGRMSLLGRKKLLPLHFFLTQIKQLLAIILPILVHLPTSSYLKHGTRTYM